MKDLSPSVVSNCLSPVERFTVKTSRTHLDPPRHGRRFTLIELLVVIAIIAIVVASKVGFFLQFSAIFAFKAL